MKLETVLRQICFTKGIGDICALSAGFAEGYCNSQGIEINNFLLDKGLKFGPLVFQSGTGVYSGLTESISDEDNTNHSHSAIKGGILGLGLGALEMGLGYCIGYTTGGISR